MSTAIGTRQCGTLGCHRVPAVDPCVHAFCDRCESRIQTRAFAFIPQQEARVAPQGSDFLPGAEPAAASSRSSG